MDLISKTLNKNNKTTSYTVEVTPEEYSFLDNSHCLKSIYELEQENSELVEEIDNLKNEIGALEPDECYKDAALDLINYIKEALKTIDDETLSYYKSTKRVGNILRKAYETAKNYDL